MKDKIRTLRERAGLTQGQLARMLGLKSPNTVTNWESGTRMPRTAQLPQLAAALGCTIDELFRGD